MKNVLLIIMLFWVHLAACPNSSRSEQNMFKYMECNLRNIHQYLVYCGIRNIDIVYKQAILETGYLTSKNFKERNNLFGFRRCKQYYTYNHWTESIEHYKRFQKENYKGGDYYEFLKNIGYAEDSLYIWKLKRIKIKT
jgi:hypothetical protein